MLNVKNKYLHIQERDGRPVALYIIADVLAVAVQDRLAQQDNVSPHDQYLSLSPS